MRIVGKTDIGRSRAENQDTFRSGYLPRGGAWGVVCDGMGGAQHGKLAATLAADAIEQQLFEGLRRGAEPDKVGELMRSALDLANAEVFKRSGNGDLVMGTTAVVAVVIGNVLHVAHIGDSRAYLFEEGKLTQLTRDHTMVQDLVDQGALTEDEASRHPEKNVITRALGVEETVQTDYSSHVYKPGSLVLLSSDGLHGLVGDARIREVLATTDFYDLPVELVSDALLAGGTDNVTVLIIEMDDVQASPETKPEEGGKRR